jgi:hypothetical protein
LFPRLFQFSRKRGNSVEGFNVVAQPSWDYFLKLYPPFDTPKLETKINDHLYKNGIAESTDDVIFGRSRSHVTETISGLFSEQQKIRDSF